MAVIRRAQKLLQGRLTTIKTLANNIDWLTITESFYRFLAKSARPEWKPQEHRGQGKGVTTSKQIDRLIAID